MAELTLATMMLGLCAYAVFGGADLGAGLWDLTAGGAHRGGRLRGMVQRSMSPVWEANHVWLIFVLVIFWTAFPVAFGSVLSTLYVPFVLAGAGLIFRGLAFAVRGQAGTIREARALGALFALSSLLVPFFLGAAIGAIASGRVPVGNAAGDAFGSWVTPTSILVGLLAVGTGAFLAAVFLAADSGRAGAADLQQAFRVRALASGAVTGALAIGGLAIVRDDARELYDGLTSGAGLAAVAISAVCGIATLGLVAARRYGLARVSAGGAVAAVTAGWALAQSPYLLPGAQTFHEGAAGDATLLALLISLAAGMALLLPSLAYLYRLVLRGRLDQELEPLDQRFQPVTAGDDPQHRR
jgi:cytochrome d ubiquinol oxidase subunit II